MNIVKFRNYTRVSLLRRIGRELLQRLFAAFSHDLLAAGVTLPGAACSDDEYFHELAAALMSPEGLPESLNEALFAIDEMSSPEGQERVDDALASSGVSVTLRENSTREDLALQVWLAAPAVLAMAHNQQRLRRLTAFFHYGSSGFGGDRPPFSAPTPEVLRQLTAGLDAWFARHRRGCQTTRIEVYHLQGEYWFVVRHGDHFSRTPKVERQHTEILLFRPERDDAVVYSPFHDEIRVNARTRRERELYREQFGLWLRSSADYFSRPQTYTLEPLRAEGAQALDVAGLEGIRKITLRELEVAWDNHAHEVTVHAADDLFQVSGGGPCDRLPDGGRLVRAEFEVQFADSARPRPVLIRPPNLLKLGRHCDHRRVDQWLCARGFRAGESGSGSQVGLREAGL